MNINKSLNANELVLTIEGRLDTTTAPALESEINAIENVTSLVIDMAGLEYISSAGLRVLLAAQKKMNKLGKMTIKNVKDVVMDVFEITGFTDVLTIE